MNPLDCPKLRRAFSQRTPWISIFLAKIGAKSNLFSIKTANKIPMLSCRNQSAPISLQVHLTMLQFDLEPALYCTYDSVRVYDGTTDRDTYLANLCGRIRSRIELASTGPSLRVDFHSDMMATETGFRAAVDFTVPSKSANS